MSVLLEYKCPCCGGSVKFDAASQKMKCPYCDTEFNIDDLNEANPVEEAEEKEENVSWNSNGKDWDDEEKENINIYSCDSCGGQIIVDSSTAASFCPYCGNPVVMMGKLSGDLKPDIIIPFRLDKKAAKEAMKKHISSKKLIPKVFKDENHIDEIRGVYVPYWLFSCDANADISYIGENVRHWSDSNYNYTETSYYDIYRSGSIGFNDIPVDGSTKMDDTLMESIEPFDVSSAEDFETAYLSGYLADRYDVNVEDSIPRANQRVHNSAVDSFRNTVKGYSAIRTKNSNIDISNGAYRYALYPVWILNTTWKNEKFTFAINGQTGKAVGDLPLDKAAFWKWTSLLGAGIGALIYAAMWIILLL